MEKETELLKLLDEIDESKRELAKDTISEYIFFFNQIKELEKLPLIEVDPKYPMRQKQTAAAKLISDFSNKIDAKRATLLKLLGKDEETTGGELKELINAYAEKMRDARK